MAGSPLSATQLRVYLLGKFRIEIDTQPIHLPTRKIESLFAYLILHPDAHAREKLAALFWGDSPDENARGSLRKALALLRKHIDSEIVLADRENIQLNPSFPLWVDVHHIENLAQELLTDPSPQLARFTEIIYPDDLITDLYEDWVLPLREYYRTLFLDVTLRGVEQARAQSEYPLAIEYAQKALEKDTANERAHQHLMFCYMTLGDRNKALEQYDACQRTLRDKLDVEPTRETQALYTWIKQVGMETLSLAARVTNLPIPISSFVGRSRELSKIKQLFSNARLVTLTGAGGSGKTRLAIHAATDLIDSFQDGVWWVELAPLTEPSLVTSTVAKALGIDSRSDQPLAETLKQYLRAKQLLLVFDNCEHLIDECAHLAESLLTSCADLKILTTSREALCLSGENVWLVPPLSLPETRNITLLDLLMEYEGVRLFIERASAINPEFMPGDENAIAITQICQRLDGIPLAIELAAARIRAMSVEQISAGLDDRFQLLTASTRTANLRHQTLHAAIDWSYNLLSEAERLLFCRLSVFSGGWTLEAAEVICSGEGIEKKDIPDLLGRLVDKSLLTINAERQRYGILETIRQYAREKSIEAGMEEWIIQKHLDYFINLAETGAEKIRGPEQLAWIKWFDAERDNLASAMRKSLNYSPWIGKGVELVCYVFSYWFLISNFIQIRYWLEVAISQSACLGRTPTRARILLNAGMCAGHGLNWLKPNEVRRTLVKEALEIWQGHGPAFTFEIAQCRLFLGYIQKHHFNDDKGIDSVRKSIEIFKKLEAYWWHAWALNRLTALIRDMSDFQVICSMLEEEAALWKKSGDRWGQAIVLFDRGLLEKDHGDFGEAEKYLLESRKMFYEVGRVGYISKVLFQLGDVTRGLKKYTQAEAYYNECVILAPMSGMFFQELASYAGLGYVALHKGDDQAAENYFYQSLKLAQQCNHKVNLTFKLMCFACLSAFRENSIIATRLFGAFHANIEALQVELGLSRKLIEPVDQLEIDHYLALSQAQIDNAVFDQAYKAGRLLSLDEAIGEILQASKERIILEP